MARYCFAWDQNHMGAWGCKATMLPCDGTNEECPFFKTMSEYLESKNKSNARLATLSEWQQNAIADSYYGGDKPWLHTKPTLDEIIKGTIEVMGNA